MIMKTKIALTLLLTATAAFASDSRFMTPTTERAQESQHLLSSAAHALFADHQNVSDLWVYPTAESDIVFAQYVVSSKTAKSSSAEQRLEVLKLKDGQIVDRHDLTHATF
jgi:hypothetical protein